MNELRMLFERHVMYKLASAVNFPNEYGETKAIFFDSIPSLGKETTVFAYLGIPSTKMPNDGFPGIVLVHGGGGCAFYEWVEYWNSKGYAAIAFDCCGQQFGSCEHDGKRTAPINPKGRYLKNIDYGSFGTNVSTVKDSWTYYNIANAIYAHNILRQNEFVNNDKIVITGISWGGVLTIMASSIDNRFAASAPIYGTGKLMDTSLKGGLNLDDHERAVWEKLYDPISYIESAEKPMLYTVGVNEVHFNILTAIETYKKKKGEMLYSYRHFLPHYHRWRDKEQMIHVSKFMDSICNDVELPFKLESESVCGNVFSISVNNPDNVNSAILYYTVGGEDIPGEWEWEQISANKSENVFLSDIPKNAKYFFFELSDGGENEFILSSSLQKSKD